MDFTVAIIDDDWSISFTESELVIAGVEEVVLDSIKDVDSPSTAELCKLLKEHGLPFGSYEERITALSDDSLYNKLPSYYREDAVDVFRRYKEPLLRKIQVIKDYFISLGFKEDNVSCFCSIDRVNVKEFDIIVIDLYLEEGNSNISLGFLETSLSDGVNRQYILMSHDITSLREQYRRIHVANSVSSTQLKVINKPESDDEFSKSYWCNSIQQLLIERELIDPQKSVQKKWTNIVRNSAENFVHKIWSLDSFGINKLRLTADADNMSLSEYLSEILYKIMTAEVESELETGEVTSTLSDALKAVDERHLLISLNEVYDSEYVLKSLFSDVRSLRPENIQQIDSNKFEDDESNYIEFISSLKFGSIFKDNAGQIFLHITQPCDYLHVPYKHAKNFNVFLFPGEEVSTFENNPDGLKKFTTSFVYIENEQNVVNIKWDLRRLVSMPISNLFNCRADYKVVGQLRNDIAQAVAHQFGSTVSRVAALRVPWFGLTEGVLCRVNDRRNGYEILKESGESELFASKLKPNDVKMYAKKISLHIEKRSDKYCVVPSVAHLHDALEYFNEIDTNAFLKSRLVKRHAIAKDKQLAYLFIDAFNGFKSEILADKDIKYIILIFPGEN